MGREREGKEREREYMNVSEKIERSTHSGKFLPDG